MLVRQVQKMGEKAKSSTQQNDGEKQNEVFI